MEREVREEGRVDRTVYVRHRESYTFSFKDRNIAEKIGKQWVSEGRKVSILDKKRHITVESYDFYGMVEVSEDGRREGR